MGCKQSKAVRVQPIGASELKKDNAEILDESTGKRHRRKNRRSLGSRDSLASTPGGAGDMRGLSATSKVSKRSGDSGLGDDYAHVITEHSDPNKVRQIEGNFKERDDINLGLTGTACQQRLSAKDKARMEEAMVLQRLREEGLISRPSNKATGGMSFEVMMDRPTNLPAIPRPPPRLAKLQKRRKKKTLTEEEIRAKLERAEERRKKREQDRLARIKEMEHTDSMGALEAFAQHQKAKEEHVLTKMDQVNDNREKRLREIQEKVKERERRAEQVRKRKQLALENGEMLAQTESQETENTPTEVTSLQ